MNDIVPRSAASEADRIMADARASLVRQRAGGRRSGAIGQLSAERRKRNLQQRAQRMIAAVVGVLLVAMGAGLLVDGIGLTGVMLTVLAVVAAIAIFSRYPRLGVPDTAAINRGDARTMVGNTELWLESQRRALPAPAVAVVDRLGVQLDVLGAQLQGLDESLPAVGEVRKLVGEHLPELVSSYTAIPAHLRAEARAGSSPDQQIAESLSRVSAEIDSVTRQLAEGQIDKLAIRSRYLDYRYGGDDPAENG